jgi:quinol monooxygenase YgiN
MSRGQIIYEVNLSPDPSIEPEFDGWLEHHVEEMLELPGFVGATIHRSEDPADDRPLRSVHYRLRDRAALDAYLADHAARMRADGVRRFGDRFQATRRILDGGRDIKAPSHTLVACANCGTLLHGQYCANCGQRARDRMISLWELVTEASEILTSLDSRLWRTLAMLLFRPGQLTRNYLLGRRARYIPALRLFLGLSLLFFFLFSLDTHFDVNATAGEDNDVDLQIGLGSSDATDPVALDETTVTATEQAQDSGGPGAGRVGGCRRTGRGRRHAALRRRQGQLARKYPVDEPVAVD